MPKNNLSQKFLQQLLQSPPPKLTQYSDEEIRGFILEYRPSGSGTWYFRYYDTAKSMRYHRIGNTKTMNAIEARKNAYHIATIIQQKKNLQQEKLLKTKALTIKQFAFEHYLPHMKLKKRSWQLDKRVLEQYIFPTFSEQHLSSIKRVEVIAWQNNLSNLGLATSTCNRIFSVMKVLFSTAERWGFLDSSDNPCKNVSYFPENIPQTRYLNRHEVQQVFAILQGIGNSRSAEALQLLLLTGARKTEILTARWEYVHFEERILTVPLSKSGKTRHIPLSDKAVELLKSLPQHSQSKKSPWLFPAHNPEKHISCLYRTWNDVRQRLGLQGVRIHDLRHSFASLLVNAGCSLYEVQKILGHYDPKVTMRYAHLAQRSLVEAANLVGKNVDYGGEKNE